MLLADRRRIKTDGHRHQEYTMTHLIIGVGFSSSVRVQRISHASHTLLREEVNGHIRPLIVCVIKMIADPFLIFLK